MMRRLWNPTLVAVMIFAAGNAGAGEPKPWQMNFQPAATEVMRQTINLHNLLLVIEISIVIIVLVLLGYIILRFNAKANPVPSKTTHNTTLEVIWTVVPVLILVAVAVPSLKLLFFMDKVKNPELTLKITGSQWFWTYEYPDNGGFEFDSIMIPDDEIKPGQRRLLEVDNRVVLPIDTDIRLLMTSTDVIHAWAIPAFGVKTDTVPGRINESWIRIERTGVYFGQCSELCGINHGFMPVAVEAVTKEEFKAWAAKAKVEFAKVKTVLPPLKVALRAPAGQNMTGGRIPGQMHVRADGRTAGGKADLE